MQVLDRIIPCLVSINGAVFRCWCQSVAKVEIQQMRSVAAGKKLRFADLSRSHHVRSSFSESVWASFTWFILLDSTSVRVKVSFGNTVKPKNVFEMCRLAASAISVWMSVWRPNWGICCNVLWVVWGLKKTLLTQPIYHKQKQLIKVSNTNFVNLLKRIWWARFL